jgi:xylulokinase
VAYLCFDIGSSMLKAGVLAEEGGLLALSRRPVPMERGPGGVCEYAPRLWIDAAFAAGAEACARAREASTPSGSLDIRAISVSGNGPTLLAADAAGEPIGRALSWLDRRAVMEAEEVSTVVGQPIDPSFYLPKALRLWRGADSDERAAIRWFFSCPEYLVFKLCGEALTYLPHPGYKPFIWDDGSLAALGLPLDRFPPFAPQASIAGPLLPAAAAGLGLEPGLPIVAGFPDFLAAIVGASAVVAGVACDRSGTSEALNLCAERPFPRRELLTLPHPIPGLWNLSGGVSTAGAALEWLSGIIEPSGTGAQVEGLLEDARRAPPGARGLTFLPYLSGERAPLWDGALRGSFVGLTLEQGRAELARAACESLAFGLRLAADLARTEGLPLDLVRVSGRSAGGELLNSIKADVLGVPVEVPVLEDCELAGDAAACAVALGDAASLEEASRRFFAVSRRFEPDPSRPYEEAYRRFTQALGATRAGAPS